MYLNIFRTVFNYRLVNQKVFIKVNKFSTWSANFCENFSGNYLFALRKVKTR